MVAVTVEEFAQSGVGVNDLGGSGETDGEVLGFVPPVSVIATNEVGRSSAVGPDGDVPGDSAPDHADRAGGRRVVAAEQPNDAGVRGVRRQPAAGLDSRVGAGEVGESEREFSAGQSGEDRKSVLCGVVEPDHVAALVEPDTRERLADAVE
jgi:hypothetical protein